MLCDWPYIVGPHKKCLHSASTETASATFKSHSSNREGIMKVLSQGFNPDTFDILISSWSQGIKNIYSQYINEWFAFSILNNISSVETSVQVVLEFLTSLIKKGNHTIKYTLESALASIIAP